MTSSAARPAVQSAANPSAQAGPGSILARVWACTSAVGMAFLHFWGWGEYEYVELSPDDYYLCEVCHALHCALKVCPKQLRGYCVDCAKVVNLDRYGNCKKGHRSVTERHAP